MTDDERVTLSGEYMLGALTAEEAANVERACAEDEALAAAVGSWGDRLADLDGLFPAVAPDGWLWQRIAADLALPAAGSARLAAVLGTVADRSRAGRRSRIAAWVDRLWGSVGFWRASGLAAACTALALAVLPYAWPPASVPVPVAVSVLLGGDSAPGWIVEAYADASLQVLPLVETAVPAGRVLELWTLRDPAEGPRSLGLVPATGLPRLRAAELAVPVPGQLFEITLEPAGGSPIGRPTGPILFKGLAAATPAF